MPTSIMLELHELTIGHKGHAVASHLSHSFAEGTLTLLTGHNGAGKSTLLRTMAGLLPPISGPQSLLLRQKPISTYTPRQLARLRAIVQTHYEPVDLTVEQVVGMGRAPYMGMADTLSPDDAQAVAHALEACSIATFAQRSFSRLSDGERQRVMIAAALAQDTPVILLDEPTAFLDYDSRQQHFRLLRTLADHGKCLICATHDLDMARRFTNLEYTI